MVKAVWRTLAALTLAAIATLGMASAAAEGMAGNDVTLINGGKNTLYIYVRYGTGSSCDDMHTAKSFTIKAGQTQKVDSGSSKVCYCLALPNHIDGCPGGWLMIPAGGSVTFQ